jgi:CBS domain-containing protein
MLTQSGEESLAVIDDEGRVAGVVDMRQIVRAIAPPEPTPVGKNPMPSQGLIHNDDTLTPTTL